MSTRQNIISCRPACYNIPLTDALLELKNVGINYAEIKIPNDENYETIARIAADANIKISTLYTSMKVEDPESYAFVERSVDGASSIGVKLIFLSVSLTDKTLYEHGIDLLKKLGDKAVNAGVKFSFELMFLMGIMPLPRSRRLHRQILRELVTTLIPPISIIIMKKVLMQ